MDISASVGRRQGRNCQNRLVDQEIVRTCLNRLPAAQGGADGSLRERMVDGICSDGLFAAILRFQRIHSDSRADGHIDPHGQTVSTLNRLAGQTTRHSSTIHAQTAIPIAPLHAPRVGETLGDGGSIVKNMAPPSRIGWNDFVNRMREALHNNPNSAAVMAYLDRVERSAGTNVPSLTETVAFGYGSTDVSFLSIQNAYVMHRGSRFGTFDDNHSLILFPPGPNEVGGALLRLEPHTLIVLLGRYSYQIAGREHASDTRLENGALRQSLGRLAGR